MSQWAESQDNPKNQKGGAAVAAAAAAAAIEAPKPEQHTAEAPPASVPAAQDPVAPAAVPAPAPEPVPAAEAQAAEAPPAAAPAPVAAFQEPAAEAGPLAYSTTRHPTKKVHIELIKDKSTRHIAFSKRKVCCIAAYWCSDCLCCRQGS